MRKFIDLSDQRFGRLLVKGISDMKVPGARVKWNCLCDCGKESSVYSYSLLSGNTKSCGCYHKEITKKSNTTHGQSSAITITLEYTAWVHVIGRCYNKNNPDYERYGGRGITVCDRWLNSFENFYADMGIKPTTAHSIDRVKNNEGYHPNNCRWATPAEQARNRSTTVYIEYNGRSMCLKDWAINLNISYAALKKRRLLGWSIEKMLTTPSIIKKA